MHKCYITLHHCTTLQCADSLRMSTWIQLLSYYLCMTCTLYQLQVYPSEATCGRTPYQSHNSVGQISETRIDIFIMCNLDSYQGSLGYPINGINRVYDPATFDVSLAGKTEDEARQLCCRNITEVCAQRHTVSCTLMYA